MGTKHLLERMAFITNEFPILLSCGTGGALQFPIRMACEESSKLPHLGRNGPGVMRIDLNSHARTTSPVVSS